MSQQSYTIPVNGIPEAELAQAQARVAANEATRIAAQRIAIGSQVRVASTEQVNIQGGVITSAKSAYKDGASTAYVTQVTPGFIQVPGMGQTSIAAAKAGGLIPHNWVEGNPLPFDEAPKAAQDGTPKGNTAAPAALEGNDKDGPDDGYAAHLAKLAGGVLDQVDQTHGAAVTDSLIEQVAESGDPESILENLPKGFQAVQVQQVMAGYIAQANTTLSAVGSSVSMLQELLTDDELRNARRATLSKSEDMLQELGRLAVDRLAKLPQSDPEGFKDMVDAMAPKAKAMLRFDRNRGDWVFTKPDGMQMSYGAAVRMGIIRV
jgi:hypothetical protein